MVARINLLFSEPKTAKMMIKEIREIVSGFVSEKEIEFMSAMRACKKKERECLNVGDATGSWDTTASSGCHDLYRKCIQDTRVVEQTDLKSSALSTVASIVLVLGAVLIAI
jgi:hypothetical protein